MATSDILVRLAILTVTLRESTQARPLSDALPLTMAELRDEPPAGALAAPFGIPANPEATSHLEQPPPLRLPVFAPELLENGTAPPNEDAKLFIKPPPTSFHIEYNASSLDAPHLDTSTPIRMQEEDDDKTMACGFCLAVVDEMKRRIGENETAFEQTLREQCLVEKAKGVSQVSCDLIDKAKIEQIRSKSSDEVCANEKHCRDNVQIFSARVRLDEERKSVDEQQELFHQLALKNEEERKDVEEQVALYREEFAKTHNESEAPPFVLFNGGTDADDKKPIKWNRTEAWPRYGNATEEEEEPEETTLPQVVITGNWSTEQVVETSGMMSPSGIPMTPLSDEKAHGALGTEPTNPPDIPAEFAGSIDGGVESEEETKKPGTNEEIGFMKAGTELLKGELDADDETTTTTQKVIEASTILPPPAENIDEAAVTEQKPLASAVAADIAAAAQAPEKATAEEEKEALMEGEEEDDEEEVPAPIRAPVKCPRKRPAAITGMASTASATAAPTKPVTKTESPAKMTQPPVSTAATAAPRTYSRIVRAQLFVEDI